MGKLWIIAGVLVAGLGVYGGVRGLDGVGGDLAWLARQVGFDVPAPAAARGEDTEWRLASAERGPIRASILATGTLQPVKTVVVGSQVSGQIFQVMVDFNDRVEAGQVVARLDPTTLNGRLASARGDLAVAEASVGTKEAALSRARAERARLGVSLEDGRRALDRAKSLAKSGSGTERAQEMAETLVRQLEAQIAGSEAEIGIATAEVAVARATVQQRKAAVDIAQTDLDRTTIRAPIAGIVIDRQVEVGQTVAASLQAPVLFNIAAALTEMRLEAAIDEADIGRVREGQQVSFTVDAYPERRFEGKVTQVRRAAKAAQNVVTYTVLVSADNSSLALFPGMTANVRVILADKADVLKVPAQALRFRLEATTEPNRRLVALRPNADSGGKGVVHVLSADGGAPRRVEVTIGVANEADVEIASGELKPGDKVIIGKADQGRRPRSAIGF